MTTKNNLQNAIVTGATSGIGAATVRALAESGRKVLAVGRREDKLKELAVGTGCEWFATDVRETAKISAKIENFVPDIVVNNAGVGHGITGLGELDPETIQEAIDINVVAPIQISAVALAGMKKRQRGHIVNIGSIAGLHTLVSALYGGTKSAIHQFSQNLRYELRGSGIRITELCPGRVSSEFYQAAAGDPEILETMGHSGIDELQPEDIASAILFALDAPAHVNISTIEILPTEQAVGGVVATPLNSRT